MSTRLKHKPPAYPVVALLEIATLLDHARTLQIRAIIDHYPYRIAAGMRIDTFESLFCHFDSTTQLPGHQLIALTARLQIQSAVVPACGIRADRALVNYPEL